MSSEAGKNDETRGVRNPTEHQGGDVSANSIMNVGDCPNTRDSPAVLISTSPQKDSDDSPDASFERLSSEEAIRGNTLNEVMQKLRTIHHDLSRDQEVLIYGKCKLLFEKDYICKVMNNLNYCMNYPIGIIVPVGKKADIEGPSMDFDVDLYSQLVEEAPEARLRSRFVAPAILFDNKFICRSGTLAVKKSALYSKLSKPSAPSQTIYDEEDYGIWGSNLAALLRDLGTTATRTLVSLLDWNTMFKLFLTDIQILEYLKVNRVFDLMVEYSKLYKQAISVSSTEKEYEHLYINVKMEELPFPGCEFFTSYHEADRNPNNLFFDWAQADVTRELKLTEDPKQFFPEINVADQKNWDLTRLTQNYLKIMLSQLLTGTGGVVIHCISGWDRTPLFVSLLRLSLWADGVIHETLEYEDITYLTVAYDWFLYGHNLPDRIAKKEEVMHFCFNFLEHITSDEFSVTRLFERLPVEEKRNRVFPEFVAGRRCVLIKIRDLFLDLYDKEIMNPSNEEETQV